MPGQPIRPLSLAGITALCWVGSGPAVMQQRSIRAAETLPAAAVTQNQATQEAGFVSLFNGQSLEGWEGNLEYFRIADGAIVAGDLRRRIPRNEFLCTTQRYSDFDLRLEVKLLGEGQNAGIQFRSRRVPDNHEVSGYQCDVGMMGPERPIWGWLYDESRRNRFLAECPAEQTLDWLRPDDWNHLRIVARGPRIELYLNGHRTVDFTETDSAIARDGVIGLQIHSGPPAEAWYRNIRVQPLTP